MTDVTVKDINVQAVETPTYLWGINAVGRACKVIPWAYPVTSVVGLTGVINQADLRTALGLGNAAYLNTGTGAGTVAVGNHTHTPASLGAEPTIAAGTSAQYWRGDKVWSTLDKAAVGLNNVDNTADADKPISSAASSALSGKEPTITAGTTGQYWRGDKTWATFPSIQVPIQYNEEGSQVAAAGSASIINFTGAGVDTSFAGNTLTVNVPNAGGGGWTAVDATATVKGILKLTNDLGGTADLPVVAKINGVAVSGTCAAGTVLGGDTASTASWKTLSSSNVSYLPLGTGASVITTEAKLQRIVDVADYGYNDAAFTKALSSGAKRIYMSAGTYTVSSAINIPASGIKLIGDGPDATIIISSATGPAINVNSGLTGVSMEGFSLKRTPGTAVSGDSGIKFTTLTEQARVSNVKLERHWIGLDLCATSYSYVTDIVVRDNYSHGVQVANNASYAGLQWSFHKCLSQTNDGYGLLYTTAAGAAPASVGDISLFSTYANKLGGVKFAGTATSPINAIRWFGGFVGEDGGHGMELDTYGSSSHKIEGLFSELAGVSPCGVGTSTPAPNTGYGLLVTANNTWVDVVSSEFVGNSNSGIDMSASRFSIASCSSRINGAAGSGQRNGIRCRAGQGAVVGCSSKGHPTYGVFTDVDTVSVIGCDLRENTTAGFGYIGGTVVNSPIIGNYGTSVTNMANPNTGWATITGTGNKGTALDVSTATLAQAVARIKELQDALTAIGIVKA